MQQTGVKLVAKDADSYLASLHQVVSAEQALASTTIRLVGVLNSLEGELSSAARDLLRLGAGAGRAGGDLDELGDDSRRADRELDRLGQGAGQAGEDVEDLCNATDCASGGLDDLGDDAREGSRGLGTLEQAAIGAARKLGELAVEGAAAAGAAIVEFVADGVKAAGDFEAGMNEFAVAAGAGLDESGQSLEEFKDLFISLGKELPVSTADVQKAAVALSKGGLEPAVISGGALRDSLNFAAAAGMDLAEAAELTVKQLGTFVPVGASVEEQTRFMAESQELLVKAAGASTLNVDVLGDALLAAGGKAKSVGVVYGDFVTTMGLISPSFASAAEAGTSYKNFLSRLQPTTADATAAMGQLNLLTAEGTSKFYDASGAFIGNKAAAELLQNALTGLSAAERDAALQAIFGNDAMGAAVALADAGAEGYDNFADKMNKASGVAETAAQKQQGFNFAVDNLMGSLEALQLTLMDKVLPGLTALIGMATTGIGAIIDYAEATEKGETFLAKLAGTINDLAVPALAGLSAATLAYAVASGTAAIGGIQNMGMAVALMAQRVALATPLIVANAGAVAMAALPYVAIGAAVGVAVLSFQKLKKSLDEGTQSLLESRQWWNDSATALDTYAESADYVQQITGEQAAALETLRAQQETAIQTLAAHATAYETFGVASGHTAESLRAEMDAINARIPVIQQTTAALNSQIATYDEQNLRSYDAIEAARAMRTSQGELAEAVRITAEDIQKLTDELVEIRDKGAAALGELATIHADFVRGMEERQRSHEDTMVGLMKEKADAKTKDQRDAIDKRMQAEEEGYQQQQLNAAKAYADQAALQRQALGEQLLAYIENQRQMGNISNEKAAEIREKTIEHFGIMRDSAAALFGDMAGSVDKFARDAGASADDVARSWGMAEDAAVDLREKANALKDKYEMEIVADFEAGRITIDEARKALADVPRRVESEIVITTTRRERDLRGDDPSQYAPGRQHGGPVDPMHGYIVGERGPEYFAPQVSGTIIPNDRIQQAMASPAQMAAANIAGGSTSIDNSRTINMPVYTNNTPSAITQSAAIVWSML